MRQYANKLASNAIFVVCRNDLSQIVGLIAAYTNNPPLCYISHVNVIDEYQRLGVLGRMLFLLETEAKQNKCLSIKLEVKKENLKAIAAYTRYGFKKQEALNQSFYMAKQLIS